MLSLGCARTFQNATMKGVFIEADGRIEHGDDACQNKDMQRYVYNSSKSSFSESKIKICG